MEKSEIFENFESRERFGRNVEIEAIFMRHGPRAEIRDITERAILSEEGKEKVREVGKSLEAGKDGIKGYTSPVERAIDTANLILEEQEMKGARVLNLRKKSELGLFKTSEDFRRQIIEMTNKNLPPNFEELEGETKQEAFDKAEDKALDWWLKLGNQRPDEETSSPQEVAVNVAKLVNKYIKMADKLYSGSKVSLFNISHKGVMEPFLREVIIRKVQDEQGRERVVRGFESIEEIGGGIKPAESWVLKIKTDERGNKNIKILIRGEEYDIDMDRLKELVHLSQEQ